MAALLSEQGCSLYDPSYEPAYSAEAIEIRVLDAVTGQPIEGVIAVAHWQLDTVDLSGQRRSVQMKILETVTDGNGRVFFPAWGPELNPTTVGFYGAKDPRIVLFKSGYRPRFLTNPALTEPRLGTTRYSDWSGRTIELTGASPSAETYLADLGLLNQLLQSIVEDKQACDWKKIPTMLRAVYAEKQAMRREGITGGVLGISSVDQYLIANTERFAREGGPECGSPKAFFEAAAK